MLFSFLQLAVGNKTSFPTSVTDSDWHRLFAFCKKQALLGIGFTAVEQLYRQGIVCPTPLRTRWMATAFQIERQNRKLNVQCQELTARYEHDGFQCCILKGQGNLLSYPERLGLRRSPGDIDLWCVHGAQGKARAVREYVMMQHRLAGSEGKPYVCYHHIEAPDADGTPIEVHFRVGHICSPLRNLRMQRWFDEQADACMRNKTRLGLATPTPSVNVVYQMTHMFKHYFDHGLGLRQLMDYHFTLRAWRVAVQADALGTSIMTANEVMGVLRSLGMAKFASAVMWVLHEVFAMPSHYYICEPNEKEGRKLLAEIMQAGNFGQYDERGGRMRYRGVIPHAIWKLRRVMRLVGSYPEEALSEPLFRVYHLLWRVFHGYKWFK